MSSPEVDPAIEKRWEGEPDTGFPVVESDDPDVYDGLIDRAASTEP